MGRRIVLATVGSLGDLHPALAIARGLVARGHEAVVATTAVYRARVEAEGVEFARVRPNLEELFQGGSGRLARYMDPLRGSERVVRELCVPHLEASADDLLAAGRGADLLVSHPLAFTVPMVAERLGIPWVSTVLAPLSLFSALDPPLPPGQAWMRVLRPLAPHPHRAIFALARRLSAPWVAEVVALRARFGLPPAGHPLFEGQHAPRRVLALFSALFGPPQPDWPPQTRVTGFPFLDHPRSETLPAHLERFLDAGEPPLVFTLGTSAVHDAGDFYAASLGHAKALGRRAVLLVGRETGNAPPIGGVPEVAVADYAPFGALFPRAAAIVHQGGIGTTAEALRSGRPMVVLPFSHDQFDNAERVRRLGVGTAGSRSGYRRRAGRRWLAEAFEPGPIAAAAAIGARIRAEDGVARAAETLLEVAGEIVPSR